ncbi:MAG: hypothetical protein Pyrs2KO_00030 [Pyruvatibacter sp.]
MLDNQFEAACSSGFSIAERQAFDAYYERMAHPQRPLPDYIQAGLVEGQLMPPGLLKRAKPIPAWLKGQLSECPSHTDVLVGTHIMRYESNSGIVTGLYKIGG